MAEIDHPGRRWDRWMLVGGPVVVLALMWWFASWSGDAPGGGRGTEALLVLTEAMPLAGLWVAGAVGLGWPIRRALAPETIGSDGLALQAGLGVAALLTLDAALGRLGWLDTWHGALAWMIPAVGIVLLISQSRRWSATPQRTAITAPWPVWITAPSLALLLLAATSAPGWLWRSEFGGYDALSYHLQLPKEWLASGRIEGLTHNVYSFLPGYVEAAYLHLMILRGDAIDSAYACQLLHALLALITALVTGRLAARIIGGERAALAGGAAAALVLGTPWVVVAGSLAYNEMAATLMLACGLLLLRATPRGAMRTALGLALLAAAACGAKLTALGFVALPLVVLLLASTPWRRWPAIAIAGALSSAVVLSPWLIGNAFVAGNPVFPFFGSVLGYGHWSAEQAAIFREGHLFSGGLGDRLVALWNQWLRHGMGANPRAGEPWLPQWSILPWLAIAGTIIAAVRGASRSALARLWCVIGVQLVFWLLATHLQSRFLLPVVVPCAVLAACGFAAIVRVTSRAAGAFAAILLLAWSVAPVMIFRGEAGGAPAARVGFAAIMAGKGLSDEQAEIAARGGARAIAINRLLPGSALVLLVGDATPFYHTRPIAYQTTWDRGPFSAAMREIPDDPASWIESLRRRGFTHLLVDPVMLRIWDRFRWNDSLLTADRVLRAAETHAEAIARFPDGSAIYCLTPPP